MIRINRWILPSGLRALRLVGLCTLASVARAEPVWQAMPNAPTSVRLDDVVFLDEQTGWVGDGTGFVHRTTDGGASWQSAQLGVYVRSLCFATRLRGWAGSLSTVKPLWSTEDGGVTWSEVTNLPDPKPTGICGMRAVNDRVVYGVGRYTGPPIVVKTVDGGATWTTTNLQSLGACSLVDCHFFDADSGFVVGGAGTSYFTDPVAFVASTWNGGASWEVRYRGTDVGVWCWKISFPTRRVGYVSIESYNQLADVLKTTDGGMTWTELPSFQLERTQGVGFVNETMGWAGD